MESANGTVKVECVHGEHFRTRAEAQQALVEYLGYYNTERRHSSLGNLSPTAFEQRWHATAPQPSAGVTSQSPPRYPPPAGFRFVASDRTGRPWITTLLASWRPS